MTRQFLSILTEPRNLLTQLPDQRFRQPGTGATGHTQADLAVEHIPVHLAFIAVQVVSLGKYLACLAHGFEHL